MSRFVSLLVLALALAAPAYAHLSVSPIILSFDADAQMRKDMLLENTSERAQYLEIQAARIGEPGAVPETYETSPIPDEVGLLVAPRRLVLQPGEQKRIRVILLEVPEERDLAWRISVSPVVGEVDSRAPVALTQVGYKALVFARPSDPRVDLIAERNGRVLTVTNAGTTNGLLHSGEQCQLPQSCTRVSGRRLWPGMTWQTDLPEDDMPVAFTLSDPSGDQEIRF